MAEPHLPTGRRVWRLEFKDQHSKTRTISLRVRDERVAKTLAHQIQEDAERLRAGMAPKNIDITAGFLGLGRNIFAPVPNWEEASKCYYEEVMRRTNAAGRRAADRLETAHLSNTRIQLARIQKDCGYKRLLDVSTANFDVFLRQLAKNGRAPKTQNEYLKCAKDFLKWCRRQGWLVINPLEQCDPVRIGAAGRRRLRRPFSLGEIDLLCDVANPWRAMVYQVAAFSGFRRVELLRLRKEDCAPHGPRPRWHVDAARTKNGMAVNLPMTPECAEALVQHWHSLPEGSLMFPKGSDTSLRSHAAAVPNHRCLARELRKAQIARQDSRGRVVDFHSFRYTFCTLLSRIYPIEVVSRFMRHSSIQLTSQIYLDLGLDREGEGEWVVPNLRPAIRPTAFPTADHGVA